jgi:hypothetical protein
MRPALSEDTPVQIKLRLRYGLKYRLEQEAARHIRTLNDEARIRLEASLEQSDARGLEDVVTDLRRLGDSLKQGAERDLKDIVTDLRVNWGRFAARFLRMELADQLADSVLAERSDPTHIRTLAQLIVEQRSAEQRGLERVEQRSPKPRMKTKWTPSGPGDVS